MSGVERGLLPHYLAIVTADHDIFDRGLLVRRRDRVAAKARCHEFLLARVADDLLERLGAVQRRFPVALDLGAYHGLLGRRLRQVPSVGMVVDVEASWRLLASMTRVGSRCPPSSAPSWKASTAGSSS